MGEINHDTFLALLDLTDQQIQTLYSILQRETREEMALRLGIAFETARSRRKALYRRLGIDGDRDVLRWAVEHDLATPMEIITRIVNMSYDCD